MPHSFPRPKLAAEIEQVLFSASRPLRQVANLAYEHGREARPLSDIDEALTDQYDFHMSTRRGWRYQDPLARAVHEHYRRGQLERARAAMARVVDSNQDARPVHFFTAAARATHAADGDYSTLITGEVLVNLAAEFGCICDADDASEHDRDVAIRDADELLQAFHYQCIVSDEAAGERDLPDVRVEDLEEALTFAEMPENAKEIIDDLAGDATIENFATAIRAARPTLSRRDALSTARQLASGFASTPKPRLEYVPGPDPFAEVWVAPGELEFARQRRAQRMLKGERDALMDKLIRATNARLELIAA